MKHERQRVFGERVRESQRGREREREREGKKQRELLLEGATLGARAQAFGLPPAVCDAFLKKDTGHTGLLLQRSLHGVTEAYGNQ